MERRSRLFPHVERPPPKLPPCKLRTFQRLETRSCFCYRLDQWVSMQVCMNCRDVVLPEKFQWGKGEVKEAQP